MTFSFHRSTCQSGHVPPVMVPIGTKDVLVYPTLHTPPSSLHHRCNENCTHHTSLLSFPTRPRTLEPVWMPPDPILQNQGRDVKKQANACVTVPP